MSTTNSGESYLAVLRLPTALPIFGAALFARLSYGLLPLALLFTIRQSTDSFAQAGTCLGIYGLTSSTLPAKARLVDIYGMTKVLPILGLTSAISLAALAGLALPGHLSLLGAIVLTAAAGLAAPPLGPAMRLMWGMLAQGTGLKQRAFALDAICEESLYLLGPITVGVLLIVASPAAALLVMAAVLVTGTFVMSAYSSGSGSIVDAAPRPPRRMFGPLRDTGVAALVLVITLTAVGTSMAFTAVAARALADGSPQAAGWIEAGVASGSVVGGLLWGRRRHRHERAAHISGLLGVLVAGLVVAAVAPGLFALGVAMSVTGLAVAPLFVVLYLGTDELAAPHHRAEASTWINTGNNIGFALGSALAGVVVDHRTPGTVFVVGAAAIFAGILVAALSRSHLESGITEVPH